MNKYLFNIKYIVLGISLSLASCVSDDLADVGDLEDTKGPAPFYSFKDLTSSAFDCNDVELWASYEFNFQAGSNLAVNGTKYQWAVTPSTDVSLINKDLPILKLLIEAELATIVAIEDEISSREFKIPCETNQDKVDVLEAEIARFEAELQAAQQALTDEVLQNVANLENQIATLTPAELTDQELIFSFPNPGDYTVSLTVTDNLGKQETTEKIITVNQAVPTIPIPEIAEPGFEDNSLFDGTGDGRGSWRAPSNNDWSPFGAGTTVIQINTKSELGILPEGFQAAKMPAGGERVLYQEIDVTPGATYVITYFTAFNLNDAGAMKVSILNPNTSTYTEAQLEENIIASRTDSNVGRVVNVFKKHAITFEAGEFESVIIFGTNTGDETRLDSFDITVKQ